MMAFGIRSAVPLAALLVVAACGRGDDAAPPAPAHQAGTIVVVSDTVRPDYFEAAGIASATEQAALSTRLMATVRSVEVLEGARVHAGDTLVRLDASDLDARRHQARAAVTEAQATADLAAVTAGRMAALYADSAAPKATLDAAETARSRAEAGLAAAQAAVAELDATAAYAVIRAPFDGIVTRRDVDPGAFAAPGAPLIEIASTGRLRIVVTVPAELARGLAAGHHLAARLEGVPVDATIEGVVPSGGNLYTINAIVANRRGTYLAGSAATLLVATGDHHVVLVPTAALVHQGDLVGVQRRLGGSAALTWITVGAAVGDRTEVLSGLAAGDSVIVPATPGGVR